MIRLQSFSHRVSGYERPNEPWICGWAAIGQPCRVGPDRRGRCQATFECQPQLKGDRWECTRPATGGGRCTEGPRPDGTCSHAIPPCVPVRSQRSRRGQIAGLSFAILMGVLALILGGKTEAWLVEPGPLTAQHAAIQQCGACHAGFAAGPIGWLHRAFAKAPVHETAQLCLACHQIGSHPLAAHSLDTATLSKLGQALVAAEKPTAGAGAAKTAPVGAQAFTLPAVARRDIACSSCHREHTGANAVLTSVGNAVCQTCHAVRFASLANGHPDFHGFPFRRRTRIIFDHVKHFDTDFKQPSVNKALVPANCDACHALAPGGGAMVVKPFAVTCGGCHIDDIKNPAGDKGIAVLGVPGLDLKTLQAHDAAIGDWPAEADGDMTAFLRFVLSRRPETAKDLTTLGTASLSDLSGASDAQIAAAARIAWAIKDLLSDLSVKGPAVLAQAAAGNGKGAVDETAALVGGLPPDAIKTAEKLWFPKLGDEIARHRVGELVPMKAPPPPPNPGSATPATPPAGGQGAIPGTENGSILGGAAAPPPATPPAGGQGAIPGTENGSILGGGGAPLGAAPSPAPSENQGAILGGGGILGGAAAAQPATPPAGGQGAIPGTENGSILGGGGAPLGAAPSPAPSENQGAILGGGGILGGAAAPQLPAAGPPPAPPKPEPPKPMDSEAFAALGGGWYRLDYYLYYRPADHADPFLHAWLDATGREAQAAKGSARLLFNALSGPSAPGVCAKCHSIDRGPGAARIVNWFPFRFDRQQHAFTKFSHRPHLSIVGDAGCKSCHQLDATANFAASYKGDDPFVPAAAFRPIKRELCAACHVARRASDSCETCHNYHVGHILPAPGMTTTMSTR